MSHPILIYDGICGLCNHFVQFILRRDRNATFCFAPLQSAVAAPILARHGANPSDLDTVYVVVNLDSAQANQPNEQLLSRSDAVIFVLRQLGSPWRSTAFLLQLMPKFLRDAAYNAVGRHRYRIFGRSEICMLPRDPDYSRFLDGHPREKIDSEAAMISAMEERLESLQGEIDKLVKSKPSPSQDIWDLARDIQRERQMIRAEIQKLTSSGHLGGSLRR